jgi:hypothetical protein
MLIPFHVDLQAYGQGGTPLQVPLPTFPPFGPLSFLSVSCLVYCQSVILPSNTYCQVLILFHVVGTSIGRWVSIYGWKSGDTYGWPQQSEHCPEAYLAG